MLEVGQRYRVVSQFNQSGTLMNPDTMFTLKWVGQGGQVGCEFDVTQPGFHSCSGSCHEDYGFWVYTYLIEEHCTLDNGKPSWTI